MPRHSDLYPGVGKLKNRDGILSVADYNSTLMGVVLVVVVVVVVVVSDFTMG